MDEWFKESVAKIQSSGMFLSLMTADYLKDPACAIQLGLAMLMDKPIVIVAPIGSKIPENLLKVARVIEFYQEGDAESAGKAARRAIKAMGEEKDLHRP